MMWRKMRWSAYGSQPSHVPSANAVAENVTPTTDGGMPSSAPIDWTAAPTIARRRRHHWTSADSVAG